MNLRSRVVFVIALTLGAFAAVAGTGWIVWRNARGVEAILEVCRNQGGLRISRTAEADGFLDLTGGHMYWAGRGKYAYVDFYAERSTPLSKQAGYQRMTVSTRGDDRCAVFERAVGSGSIRPGLEYGLSADQCFVVEPLSERPLGFVYGRRDGALVAPNGIALRFHEVYVADERDGRDLAVSRDYGYYAPYAAALDASGGGGTAYASCGRNANMPPVYAFVDQVLIEKPTRDDGVKR